MAEAILKQPKALARRKTAVRGTSKGVKSKLKKTGITRPEASKRVAAAPDAAEIAEREAVARAFFNPASARAARAAFLKR